MDKSYSNNPEIDRISNHNKGNKGLDQMNIYIPFNFLTMEIGSGLLALILFHILLKFCEDTAGRIFWFTLVSAVFFFANLGFLATLIFEDRFDLSKTETILPIVFEAAILYFFKG